MALVTKTLQAVKLGTTAFTAPYSVVEGKSAVISALFVYNPSGSAVSLNLGVRMAGGSLAYIHPPQITLAANTWLEFTDEITLAYQRGAAAGDRLEAWSSVDQTVQFVVFGVERDI